MQSILSKTRRQLPNQTQSRPDSDRGSQLELRSSSLRSKQYLQQQKIELFAQKECDRYIKRANAQFEKEFFTKICTDLSEQTLQQFNELISDVNDAENSGEENLKNNPIRMYHLKKDIPNKD